MSHDSHLSSGIDPQSKAIQKSSDPRKKYRKLSNDERHRLIYLIHNEGYSIRQAAKNLGIPYPNAKAVNLTYLVEKRINKKVVNFRSSRVDKELEEIVQMIQGGAKT